MPVQTRHAGQCKEFGSLSTESGKPPEGAKQEGDVI